MKTPTYEEFLADPDAVLAAAKRAARAARAEAVDQLIVTPLKQAWKRITQERVSGLETRTV